MIAKINVTYIPVLKRKQDHIKVLLKGFDLKYGHNVQYWFNVNIEDRGYYRF